MKTNTNTDQLRKEILVEFKQVHKLAPADYTENCTNVVMAIIDQYVHQKTIEARIDELDKFTKEHARYNDGCGCCSTETIRQWNDDTESYDGEITSEWSKARLAELQASLNREGEK